ncbi:hypothetical protein HRTV-11_gp107 [Halorubrum virus HRTV-11]|nr:hypothetical protein HRTV-11_gp107 [Halorubrum virus HRTV-11]
MTTMTAYTFSVLGGLPPSRRSSGTLPARIYALSGCPSDQRWPFGPRRC